MATYATFQRRKIKERRREIRLPWMILLLVCVAAGAAVGALAQSRSSTDELPVWVVFALVMGAIAIAMRPQLEGTYHLQSSIEAEGWTSNDLRRELGAGWHVVTGVDFSSQGDVDQIAVGPSGILVVETKSTDRHRIDPRTAERWAEQVLGNARRVRLMLKHNYGHDMKMTPLIIVSGMKGIELPTEAVGVPIVRRGKLKSAVEQLTQEERVLTVDEAQDVRAALLDYRGRRTDYEREKEQGLTLMSW